MVPLVVVAPCGNGGRVKGDPSAAGIAGTVVWRAEFNENHSRRGKGSSDRSDP